MLRTKLLKDQLESAEQVIFSLASAVEAKDAYTAGHIERVSSLAVAIAGHMGFDEATRAQLYRGGILHDIGKIGVPDSILNKAGKLLPEEFAHLRRHPDTGERICRSLKTLQPVLDLIRHHHERLDGSGYPDGLAGSDISQPARVLAVCDVYDALTSQRPYRSAMTSCEALEALDRGVRDGHWDTCIVDGLKAIVNA
jgi:putative two-component system response regulator